MVTSNKKRVIQPDKKGDDQCKSSLRQTDAV